MLDSLLDSLNPDRKPAWDLETTLRPGPRGERHVTCLLSTEDDLVGPAKSNKRHVAKASGAIHTDLRILLTQLARLKPRC